MFNPAVWTAMSPEQYGDEWAASAAKFAANGHYDWMVQQLGSRDRVLEVGCGSGEATLCLARAGKRVTVIEVNGHLISKTVSLLDRHGISADVVNVADIVGGKDGGVTIIEANLFDPALPSSLSFPFDAIACWMTGGHPQLLADRLAKDPYEFQGEEMAIYRQHVHKHCYDLGRSILNKGGIVHVVDRMGITSWNDKDEVRSDLADIHLELFEKSYSISKKDCYLRRIGIDEMGSSRIRYIGDAPTGTFVLASTAATLVG